MLNSKIRPRAVVGYGVKISLPSPPYYVTRSPGSEHVVTYPRFPLSSQSNEQYEMPADPSEAEKSLLNSLQVDEDKLNDIEIKTRSQSGCPEWKLERKFRFTASNFGLIRDRKRNHESLVKNLINPKPFSSRYTNHGVKYEPIALEQYQKYDKRCL